MAREHANIKLAMLNNPDYRQLSVNEKLLYITLLLLPSMTYCGVFDWRPARLAALVDKQWTEDDVRVAAAGLEARLFIVLDDATEEGLVRSYVRNDGLMRQPNLGVSMARAYDATVSSRLRGVLVHELRRLRQDQPDLPGWKRDEATRVLEHTPVDPREVLRIGASTPHVTPPVTPYVTPTPTPEVTPDSPQAGGERRPDSDPSDDPPSTTSYVLPTTCNPQPSTDNPSKTSSSSGRSKGTRISKSWKPSVEDLEWARDRAPDLDLHFEAERFRNYWTGKSGKDATKVDWAATWRNWILNALKFATAKRPTTGGASGAGSVSPSTQRSAQIDQALANIESRRTS